MMLWRKLSELYGESEARAIARYVLEEKFGMAAADIYCGNNLPDGDAEELSAVVARLMQGEPVQYVLDEACFCGRRIVVRPGVLIPRPETEELAEQICRQCTGGAILDIGTGSGCIAVTLALDIAGAEVTAWDISCEALSVAGENARRLGARVRLERQNALRPPCDCDRWDVIVSNPPYVCDNERAMMHKNVLAYEPAQALFVPDEDPLLFYRAITRYAAKALRPGGRLYFEINPLYAGDMREMVAAEGFANAEITVDQYGKQRMMRVWN